jgi:hypothetical protein
MPTRYVQAVKLLAALYHLSAMSSKDAFKNGVTDSSGTMDEGETRAGELLGEVHEFLKEETDDEVFDVGTMIFYLREHRVHSAPIMCRSIVENKHDDYASTPEQKAMWQAFGPSGIRYNTCHGMVMHEEAFGSRQALVASIAEESPRKAVAAVWHLVISTGVVQGVYGSALREQAEELARQVPLSYVSTYVGSKPHVGDPAPAGL